jgi:predicted secreted Zn-dependent protease
MPALNARWRKSTRSGDNGACVEARAVNDTTQIRDSKNPSGPVLTFTREEWHAFIDGVKQGEFDI